MKKSPTLKSRMAQFLRFPLFLGAIMFFLGTLATQARYFEVGSEPATFDIAGLGIAGLNGTFNLQEDAGEFQINANIYTLDGDEYTTLELYADGTWVVGRDGSPADVGPNTPYKYYATGNMSSPGVSYTSLNQDSWDGDDETGYTYNDGITTWFSEDGGWAVSWAGGGFGPAYLATGGTSLESGSTAAFADQAAQLNVGLEFSDGQWIVK
jgi:hypothetical protein